MLNLTHLNFQQEVLKETKTTIVDFYGTWCPPCKMLAPILEKISENRKDLKVVKVDVDKEYLLAEAYKVDKLPTILIFKNGKECKRLFGLQSENVILEATQ